MIPENLRKILKKQHYALIGNNSAIQICRWTKKSLLNEGVCYKEKFYGIKSHRCCQMSPCVMFCQNKCIHCWRPIEKSLGTKIIDADNAKKIIEQCILNQRKLLTGFGGNYKVDKKKLKEAQEPNQFAISLSGEPTLYPYLAEIIQELRKQGKTSFLVTNGLGPEKILELEKKNALPTQLYISLNSPNKKMYEEWHRSCLENAWERFNKSLNIMSKINGKTRTVIRMTLVRNLNMCLEEDYAKLILKANPDFIEVKSFMSVGYSRKRLAYERMPSPEEVKEFAEKLVKNLESKDYKILDEKEESRVVLIGKDKEKMKIKPEEI
ncbi:MAG: 4-demethylwyosine synthase TYW1 [Candidatus Pacearchaeota archaeon]